MKSLFQSICETLFPKEQKRKKLIKKDKRLADAANYLDNLTVTFDSLICTFKRVIKLLTLLCIATGLVRILINIIVSSEGSLELIFRMLF